MMPGVEADQLHFHCVSDLAHRTLLHSHSDILLSLSDAHAVRVYSPSETEAQAQVDDAQTDVQDESSRPLNGRQLLRALSSNWLGHVLILASNPSSTQCVSRDSRASHGMVVMSGAQRQGRGRRGAVWMSPAGSVAMTLALCIPRESAALLTFVQYIGALAVAEAARAAPWSVDARVKWPNDVLLDGKKVSGVLCEASATPSGEFSLRVGIGVNVTNAAPAARLDNGDAGPFARERFAAAVLARFEIAFDQLVQQGFEHSGLQKRYLELWLHSEQRVRIGDLNGPCAVVKGLAADGRVRVFREDLGALQDLAPEETSLDIAVGLLREKTTGSH